MESMRKILVPTDFSEGAGYAMHEALDLAQALGAEITLLHAYQLPNYVLPDGSVVLTTAEAHASLVASSDSQLAEVLETARGWNVPVTTMTREGAAADDVAANNEEVDPLEGAASRPGSRRPARRAIRRPGRPPGTARC